MAHWTSISRKLFLCLTTALGLWTATVQADDFLPPEKAFAFSAKVVDDSTVRLHWDIAPGYHLYRERISVQADAQGAQLAPLNLPKGKDKFDTNFNKTMVIYEQALDVDIKVTQGSAATPVTVGWQGCADAGLCYPPDSAQMQVALTGLGASQNLVTMGGSPAQIIPVSYAKVEEAPVKQAPPATDSIASTLASGSLLRTMGVFWLAGLLLAFTPCVLPMVPILSSLIAGQTGPVSRSKVLVWRWPIHLAWRSYTPALVWLRGWLARGSLPLCKTHGFWVVLPFCCPR